MWSMTRSAIRGNNQTLLEKTFAVNTLREVLKDVVLMDNASSCNWCSFLVTLAAEEWNLQG